MYNYEQRRISIRICYTEMKYDILPFQTDSIYALISLIFYVESLLSSTKAIEMWTHDSLLKFKGWGCNNKGYHLPYVPQ